jgi:hypothetical protein
MISKVDVTKISNLPSQLNAVAKEACFARVRSGKVSPMMTARDQYMSHMYFVQPELTPNERTPGGGETCDEHASSDNHDDTGRRVVLWRERNTDDGEDEQPGSLPEAANDERNTAADSLNEIQSGNCHYYIDSTKNELNLERIINACGLEDGRSIL